MDIIVCFTKYYYFAYTQQLSAHISNAEEQQIDPVVHRVREQTKELRMY